MIAICTNISLTFQLNYYNQIENGMHFSCFEYRMRNRKWCFHSIELYWFDWHDENSFKCKRKKKKNQKVKHEYLWKSFGKNDSMEKPIWAPVMSVCVETSIKYWIEMVSSLSRSDWDIIFAHSTSFSFFLSKFQMKAIRRRKQQTIEIMAVWLWAVEFLRFFFSSVAQSIENDNSFPKFD